MGDTGDTPAIRRVDALFARYGESHRHPANKAIHWVCVPLITWSLLAALWAWTPLAAYALITLAMAFYLTLSVPLAIGMLAASAPMIFPPALIPSPYVLAVAIVVFVLAWIGQFVGHRIEGKKPSFLEDVKFLLVGPAWLLGFVYRRLSQQRLGLASVGEVIERPAHRARDVRADVRGSVDSGRRNRD